MRLVLGGILGIVVMTGAVAAGLVLVVGATYHPDLAIPTGVNGRSVRIQGELMRVRQGGSGPDVLLIHDATGSIEDWRPVWDLLTRHYHVTAFDRPGMGYSDAHTGDATVAANARKARALIQTLDLGDVLVVGQGYGAAIALAMAESGQVDARGYLLLDPEVYPGTRVNASRATRLLAKPVLGEGLARLVGPFSAPESIARRLRDAAEPSRPAYPDDFVALRQRLWSKPLPLATVARQRLHRRADLARVASRLEAVDAPATALTGGAEPPAAARQARRLSEALPRMRWTALPHVHHYIQFEAPRAVAAAVKRLSPLPHARPAAYSAGSTALAASGAPARR